MREPRTEPFNLLRKVISSSLIDTVYYNRRRELVPMKIINKEDENVEEEEEKNAGLKTETQTKLISIIISRVVSRISLVHRRSAVHQFECNKITNMICIRSLAVLLYS